MNRDRVEGGWKKISGMAREQWSALRGDEPGVSAARRTRLEGGIQVRRGISKDEAERQLREFMDRNRDWDTSSH